MIDDLAAYGSGATIDTDLCVVGAGAAGIAIAHEFLQSDVRVLVVEAGGWKAGPSPLAGRGRGFGGTTALWAGQCIPFDAIDFERREWVPHSGWPISRSELSGPYARAAALLGVPGETYDEALWRRWRTSPPPIDDRKLRHTYTVWAPQPNLGRLYGAEFRRSRNVRVLLNATVTNVQPDASGGAVEQLVVRTEDGGSARITARASVLCCGGVENARLLLASGNPDAGGVGNGAGNVGRYFQDHPNGRVAVVCTDTPRTLQESYSLFYRRRRRYLPKLALATPVQRSARVLNCAANLEYEFADEGLNAMRRLYRVARGRADPVALGRDLRLAVGGLPAVARGAYRRFALGRSSTAEPATIWIQTHSEQAPNPDSRIVLGRERDVLGSPVARIEWRLTELERRTAETMAQTLAEELARLGLAQTRPADWLADPAGSWESRFGDAYHHAGATRMAADPAHGVVDPDCRVHGVAGLYVAGSSVFPTSGFANPTLTIVAMALRLADHLRGRVGVSGARAARSAGP